MKLEDIDKLIELLRFLKDNYKREAFDDVNFGASLVKHHMDDYCLELTDEQARGWSFMLQKVND